MPRIRAAAGSVGTIAVLAGVLGVAPLVVGEGTASAAGPPPGAVVVGVSGPDCPSPAFATISDAVAAATAGETIFACAGTYNESVTVNKDITLLGAEFGVPATTPRPGPESIVTGGITYVTGGSAGTVDGFTLDGDGNPNSYGIKGQTAAGAEGYAWEDNIIENNRRRSTSSTAPGRRRRSLRATRS